MIAATVLLVYTTRGFTEEGPDAWTWDLYDTITVVVVSIAVLIITIWLNLPQRTLQGPDNYSSDLYSHGTQTKLPLISNDHGGSNPWVSSPPTYYSPNTPLPASSLVVPVGSPTSSPFLAVPVSSFSSQSSAAPSTSPGLASRSSVAGSGTTSSVAALESASSLASELPLPPLPQSSGTSPAVSMMSV